MGKTSISKSINSLLYSVNGLKLFVKEEYNARIHLFFLVLVVFAGFALNITNTEWLVLCITMALVISLEIINTAIEALADFVCQEKHQQIKKVKDLAAAAVLFASIFSVIIGFIIFLPKIIVLCTI